MNIRLKEAFKRISQLPDADQERMAVIIEEELEDDAAWDAAFAKSLPQLRRLAQEARAQYHAGLTEPLDPDAL